MSAVKQKPALANSSLSAAPVSLPVTDRIAVAPMSIVDRYIFVSSLNAYYDLQAHILLCASALNTKYGATSFVKEKGKSCRCAYWLSQQNNATIVDELGWIPCRYDEERPIIIDGAAKLVNTWKGFAITPSEGDVQPWLDHVEHLFPDPVERKNFIDRLAFDVQYPDRKCNWHTVILGVRGAGKDAVLIPLFTMFGAAGSTIGNKDIKSDFDDGFAKTKVVCISEVNGMSGDAMEELKRKATSGSTAFIMLNPKKEKKVKQANLWSLYPITNHNNAMHLAPDERRFYVLEALTAMTVEQKSAYFDGWLNNQGAAHLFHYLLNRDLSSFDPDTLPGHTPAFYKMVSATTSEHEKLLQDWADEGSHGFSSGAVKVSDLRRALLDARTEVSTDEIIDWLASRGFEKYPKQIQKKLDGETKRKSRGYCLNADLLALSSADLYEAIDDIEKAA